jgi:transmembrane sensor
MLTTPGQQHKILLTDGSKIWLNARSSMRYPPLKGPQRRVRISGEAYFEVSKSIARPFIVNAGGAQIRTTSAVFNVNSYEDEPFATVTLLEGKLEIKKEGQKVPVQPGQQAQVKSSSIQMIDYPDIAAAIAWKSGHFDFDNADIQTVMRQIGRWYDIEVQYEGNRIPSEVFWGDMPHKSSLHDLLWRLQTQNVKFRIDGRTVVVLTRP